MSRRCSRTGEWRCRYSAESRARTARRERWAWALVRVLCSAMRAMAELAIGGDSRLRENHALCRIVELDAQTAKFVDDAKIHGLLEVEQGIEIGLLNEVRELEVQRRIAQRLQVAALETSVRMLANDALEQYGYFPERVGGRFVGHANRRQRA